jgi:mono/diheme cytochrome c family protein
MSRRHVIGLVTIAIVAGGALYAGYREAIRHGFSARAEPWAIEEFVARRLRKMAMGTEAARMKNPYAPNRATLAEASDHFAEHCALCHGDDGSGKTEIGEGLYPPVPDLREAETQELSDGELFQIIHNGIRFTGMPAWAGSDTDEEIWKLVLFVRRLPDLSEDELARMRERHRANEPPPHTHRTHH